MIGGCENYTFAFLGGGEQNLTLERKVCVEKNPIRDIWLESSGCSSLGPVLKVPPFNSFNEWSGKEGGNG